MSNFNEAFRSEAVSKVIIKAVIEALHDALKYEVANGKANEVKKLQSPSTFLRKKLVLAIPMNQHNMLLQSRHG